MYLKILNALLGLNRLILGSAKISFLVNPKCTEKKKRRKNTVNKLGLGGGEILFSFDTFP